MYTFFIHKIFYISQKVLDKRIIKNVLQKHKLIVKQLNIDKMA